MTEVTDIISYHESSNSDLSRFPIVEYICRNLRSLLTVGRNGVSYNGYLLIKGTFCQLLSHRGALRN